MDKINLDGQVMSNLSEKLKETQNMPCNPRDWYVNSWHPKIQIWEKCPGGKRMVCEGRDEAYTAFLCCAANNYQDLVERIRELEAENADLRNQLKAALERC
jgi:hypothetical protein